MKWDEMRRSDNVEDERGSSGGGGGGGLVGGLGIGGTILALIVGMIFGVNPAQVLRMLQGGQVATAPKTQTQTGKNDRDSDFVKAVLGDTEDTWNRIFPQQVGKAYQPPKLVLFSGGVKSACGSAQTASGPFYCPADQKVYLDMAFFQHLQATAGPHADFARAYAIAHEVGHHVQNLTGVSGKVRNLKAQSSKTAANALSVKQELQADCFAGVWGHFTAQRGLVGDQDIAAALNTATQIGDDYLQKQARGYVTPESFTHGSSQQRVSWFQRGLKTGDMKQCDTFTAK